MKATHACIEKELLTDASFVYNVRLTDEDSLNAMVIPCFTEKAALDLLRSLESNALIETD